MKLIPLAILCCIATAAHAQTRPNPLLTHSAAPIAFDKVTAATINTGLAAIIKISDQRIQKITAIPAGQKTFANTMMALDELYYDLGDFGSCKLGLIGATFTNDDTRNAANDAAEKMSLYSSNLQLNEGLYNAVKQYAATAEAKALTGSRKKFLEETILAFEKNGMKLDAAGRQRLEDINKKIIGFGTAFDKNLAEWQDSIQFTAQELAGLPENISAPWKNKEDSYTVPINGPNYNNIVKYADAESTRKAMLVKYYNRAYPANITTLDSLLYYRSIFAKQLGFSSYAAYAVADKMAATTANVWDFENRLLEKLTPAAESELAEFKAFRQKLYPGQPATYNLWDQAYFNKKLLDYKYGLNTDEVRQYFEMDNTLRGMFGVYAKLFSIEIKEVKNMPVWYSKVRTYELYKGGKKMGSFYLDLFPRPNKYTHFACFPISQYRIANGKEALPVSALICNFPEANATEPSLLNHSDVVTLFHEFGHLVHSMLGRTDIASLGPFYTKGDFVEAPSQFLENWCWQYESLSQFTKHYKSGQPLPKSLFEKMDNARKLGASLANLRSVALGMTDFLLEDKYDSIKGKDISVVGKEVLERALIPYPSETHFLAGWTHLNGYGANYYGYLWSKVFAEDMFSVFKKNGVMNTATGLRYRHLILEQSATKPELDMLREFLERDPNDKAFLESLGVGN